MDSAAARRNNPKESAAAGGAAGGQIVCNGPYCEYFRVKRDEPKWLETAVYVDHSVVAFHGRETVKQYVLTLLNIVSAIYGDPTLGANLKFVILRLVFYEDPAAITSPIVEDDSKVKRGGGTCCSNFGVGRMQNFKTSFQGSIFYIEIKSPPLGNNFVSLQRI